MKTYHYLILALAIVLVTAFWVYKTEGSREWVRGYSNTAKYCYAADHAPETIRYKVYFASLEECEESLGRQIDP